MKKIIINVCTPEQYTDIPGIHLNAPSSHELSEAIYRAGIQGFTVVFCHYQAMNGANYIVPSLVMEKFLNLKKSVVKVVFTHP